MLKRATDYLSKSHGSSHGEGAGALIGMALYKAGIDKSHPKIQQGIENSRALANRGAESAHDTYAPALCCILLCEVDPDRYRPDISKLVNGMIRRQHSNGGWSYSGYPYDDTSQTQYGVLCLWTAHHADFDVPPEAIERAARWLLQHQDPTGGWTYKPAKKDAGTHAMHKVVTHSMSSAGAGSLYMCAHLFGLAVQAEKKSEEDDLPSAVTRVEKEERGGSEFLRANRQLLMRGLASGNVWFSKNLNFNTNWWTHYYMYGLERYKSFQELVEGKKVAEPDWYSKGVEYLRKTQSQDGSWKSREAPTGSAAIDTAFAVLFLARSSQKSIRKAVHNEGVLQGGYGLPKDLTNVRMDGGQLVTPQMVREVDDFLKLIEDAEDKEFDATALPGELSLDEDLTKRTSQLEQLRELVSNEDYRARRTAVKTLAADRDLDNVPILIYALTDEDPEVPRYARDGLRFISRKLQGSGMPDKANEQQKQAAVKQWKKWYLSIRPDGEFVD